MNQIKEDEDDNPIMGPGQASNFNQRNFQNKPQIPQKKVEDNPMMGPGAGGQQQFQSYQRPP